MHLYAKGKICVSDFAKLLKDRVFVDYLNVFLGQAIFSQRLMYRYSTGDFEFDPPLKRSQYKLDRHKLVGWLLEERIPLFVTTSLYMEYTLCRHLLQTKLTLSESCHNLNEDEYEKRKEPAFLEALLGHVAGMQRFRRYLSGGVGESVLNFWMDAEEFWSITCEQERHLAFREIQGRYFHNGSALGLPENEKWREFTNEAMSFANLSQTQKTISVMSIPCIASSGTLYGRWNPNEKSAFRSLQNLMLSLLKDYWLPKYVMHVRREVKNDDRLKQWGLDNITGPRNQEMNDFVQRLECSHRRTGLGTGQSRAHAIRMNAMFRHLREQGMDHDDDEERLIEMHSPDAADTGMERDANVGNPTYPKIAEYDEADSSSDGYPDSVQPSACSSPSLHGPDTAHSILKRSNLMAVSDHVTTRKSKSPDLVSPTGTTSGQKRGFQMSSLPKLTSSMSRRHNSSIQRLTKANINEAQKQHLPRVASYRGKKSRTKRFTLLGMAPSDEGAATPSGLIEVQEAPETKVVRWLRDRESNKRRRKSTVILPPLFKKKDLQEAQLKALTSFVKHAQLGYVKQATVKQIAKTEATPLSIDTYHSAVTWYRHHYRHLVSAVAADSLCGRPFLSFLKRNGHRVALTNLELWNDIQTYICTRSNDINNLGERTRTRLSRSLCMKYFHPVSRLRVDMERELKTRLVDVLETEGMDDSLLHAQDVATEMLRRVWIHFVNADKKLFHNSVLVKTKSKRHTSDIMDTDLNELYYEDVADNRPNIMERILDPIQDEDHDSSMQCAVPERMWRALDLVQDVSGISFYPADTMTFERIFDFSDDGSLYIEPIVHTTKFDYVRKLLFPTKINIDKILVSKKDIYEPEKILRRTRLADISDSRPAYLRPIWRNGQMIERPARPRTFTDILRDNIHVEFFRRFLYTKHRDTALGFWISVEELKTTPPGKPRQTRVSAIVKKFFSAPDKGKSLNCDADVIREIPNMERVTQAMLISAQSCIAKSLEEKWAIEYLDTFGHHSTEEAEGETDGVREWTKEKTKLLWLEFVRVVAMFRRGILNRDKAQRFRMWLKYIYPYEPVEPRYDANKKANQTSSQAVPSNTGSNPGPPGEISGMKRIFRGKVVLVERLVCDLNFLIEVDRYRQLADNAARQAAAGSYSSFDENLMLTKATAIIRVYLDSDIYPRVQINASTEIADLIIDNYNNHYLDRGLFHDATHVIFPVLCLLWKRFCVHEALDKPIPDEDTTRRQLLEMRAKMFPTPVDYTNIRPGMARHVLGYSTHEEEPNFRFHFSLMHGLRQVISIPRPISGDHGKDTMRSRDRRNGVQHESGQGGPKHTIAIKAQSSVLRGQNSSMSRRKPVMTSRNSLAVSNQSINESRDMVNRKLAIITSNHVVS